MADKTLHEFSAPTMANIRTRPMINIGDNSFELKPALINMVQATSGGLCAPVGACGSIEGGS
jgi:hypothetical protein